MSDIHDSVDKSAGRGYIIIDGKMESLTGMTKINAKRKVKTRTKQPLGERVAQSKTIGIENEGSLTVDHYETARFNKMVDEYEATGIMPEFDLQIVNEDKGSTVGRRVVRYYSCTLKEDVSLSELEEGSEDAVTADIGFTFRKKEILEDYKRP